MSDNNTDTPATPQVPSSLQRLEALEKRIFGHQQAFQFVDRELTQLKNVTGVVSRGVDSLAELITAHLEILGEEFKAKVTAVVEANREKARQQKEDLARTAIKTRLEKGELLVSDEVAADSLVVFTEFDKEGKQIGIHYTPVWLHELGPEISPKFIGQKVGFEGDVEGGKLCVLEIYKAGIPPAPDVPAPVAAVTPEAPTNV